MYPHNCYDCGCHATEILVASDCSPCSLALDSPSVRACSQWVYLLYLLIHFALCTGVLWYWVGNSRDCTHWILHEWRECWFNTEITGIKCELGLITLKPPYGVHNTVVSRRHLVLSSVCFLLRLPISTWDMAWVMLDSQTRSVPLDADVWLNRAHTVLVPMCHTKSS